jgi:modification methylase ecoRI (adenine-specificmethyltransferase ecoRI)
MARKDLLNTAKKQKKDEFYTTLEDIEKELVHYTSYFEDKVVFCNCDDPDHSNFYLYFLNNFKKLKLKRLIALPYVENSCSKATIVDNFGDRTLLKVQYLRGDGDFRSRDSLRLLKEADIVVTNPPFSLFREFIDKMYEYDKKFLIIGNINALSYKNVISRLKTNEIRLGISITSGDRKFWVPDDYPLNASSCGVEKVNVGNKVIEKPFIRVPGVRWFTNFPIHKPLENRVFNHKYSLEKYPKYDNFDAIEVAKSSEVPTDYYGLMGVPITFMDKFDSEEFEFIGPDYEFAKVVKIDENKKITNHRFVLNGKIKYARFVIRRKNRCLSDND